MSTLTQRGNKGLERGRGINFLKVIACNEDDGIIERGRGKDHRSNVFSCWGWKSILKNLLLRMNRRLAVGLLLIIVIVAIVVAIVLLTIDFSDSKRDATYCVSLKGEQTCHSTDNNPYRFYGTKTSYHIALPNTTDDSFHFEGCVPKLFYLFSRHATRYPDREQIEEMIEKLPILKEKIINSSDAGKCNICQKDIEKLKVWNFTLVPDDDNRISITGEEEAIGLAQRYKRRFPSILDKDFSPNSFVFQFTSKERTLSTAEAFAKGLFGTNKSIHFYGQTNDKVLQFHKECKKLTKKCNDTRTDLTELEAFETGVFMKSLLNSVSKRLGFEVSFDDVKLMNRMCNFGYALGIDDIWCSVFSYDDLKVLEFEADIDDYYKDGYGNKLSYEQACPVVDYLVQLFRTSIHRSDQRAVLQFSHAGAIKKVYARLGLFRDAIPLTSDNFCSQLNRKWKSSLVVPFNSNIAIALYECNRDHKIAAFHNEEPVVLGGCHSTLCPLQDFLNTYRSISESCNIKELCCSCCVP